MESLGQDARPKSQSCACIDGRIPKAGPLTWYILSMRQVENSPDMILSSALAIHSRRLLADDPGIDIGL